MNVVDTDDEDNAERLLLEQLQELHRQLAVVRGDPCSESTTSTTTSEPSLDHHHHRDQLHVPEGNKMIVCSMRRCIRMEKSPMDDAWGYFPSHGGLKDAIKNLDREVVWISWPGAVVDASSQEGVRCKLQVMLWVIVNSCGE